ncbi:dUTP diphosphatase [Corynebacterium rhinophilum]|uniref:dUTP diphosphatase n=1 Tax=Corynebacterium rhinophilum TaxID=3050197 RepID=UPI00254E2E92|nr:MULTISPECIES: dUTP diphosphatase [unclassified Corynebacterium]MDK8466937.1 dUTP diphosphatase [Corynebacterium sp. MSK130]MDK8687575.1 dUTP diphosphatase [Corynebacterium sp. MSK122]
MIYYQLNDGAAHPRQAYRDDAGIDLAAKHDAVIPAGGHKLVSTGVHVAIPRGHVGMIFVRSSTGIKRKLVLYNGTGIIDSGYRGELLISLHNTGDIGQRIEAGDYIAQLVTVPVLVNEIAEVRELPATQRGARGIGSSDK